MRLKKLQGKVITELLDVRARASRALEAQETKR